VVSPKEMRGRSKLYELVEAEHGKGADETNLLCSEHGRHSSFHRSSVLVRSDVDWDEASLDANCNDERYWRLERWEDEDLWLVRTCYVLAGKESMRLPTSA
jgi:hypothetical protein